MVHLRDISKTLMRHYALGTDDMDLMRAQFHEFVHLIPLLYVILACNACALTVRFIGSGSPMVGDLFPAVLISISVTRGIWWFRRRHAQFTDPQIRKHMRNTSV